MSVMKMRVSISIALLAPTLALFLADAAHAAVPGITGPTFNLTAQTAFLNQPDGNSVYSWGYGCSLAPTGFAPPAALMPGTNCPTMQVPGPTLIVTEGQTVTVHLTNNLPRESANTTIRFPCVVDSASGELQRLITTHAPAW